MNSNKPKSALNCKVKFTYLKAQINSSKSPEELKIIIKQAARIHSLSK